MKKYLIVVISLSYFCLSARVIKLDKVEAEIKALNFTQVQKSLEKLSAIKDITPDELKAVYADLHDAAADAGDNVRFNKYFWKSWKDLVMTVIGSLGMVGGFGAALIGPTLFRKNENLAKNSRLGGSLLGLLSSFVFYKGITCSTQRSWVAQAKEMQKYFENKQKVLDAPEDSEVQE